MNTYTYINNSTDYRTALWKLRRERQMRTRLFASLLTLLIVLIGVLSYCAFSAKAESVDAKQMFKYYTWVSVEGGDTLTDIAETFYCADEYKSFNNYLNEICKINHLNSADDIKIGSDLCIPYFSPEFK